MRILIDSDGVIVDFVSAHLKTYEKHGGIIPKNLDMTEYYFTRDLPSRGAIRATWGDHGLFKIALPYPGAIDKLRQLHNRHEVYIVTDPGSRPQIHVPAKFAWYQKHAPFIGPDQFIFTRHKHMITGDVLIEDKLTTVYKWAMTYRDSRVIMIEHPWNYGPDLPNVTTANSLAEVEV